MANRDNPKGLTPRFHMSGGTIRTEQVLLAAANTIVGVGDPLLQTSAGVYDIAAPGGRVDAVAAAPSAASSGGEVIPVYRDPNIVFSAQTDNGTGTATSQDAVNLNIDFVIGSAVNGRSIMELDESSAFTTATLPYKIRGIFSTVDNDFGQFNELLVTLNNTVDKGGTGTIGK